VNAAKASVSGACFVCNIQTYAYMYFADVNSVFEDVSPVNRGNTIPSRVDIPPPAPGYRRTPDLLRLVSFLNEFPQK
jgi:hypothetical protein